MTVGVPGEPVDELDMTSQQLIARIEQQAVADGATGGQIEQAIIDELDVSLGAWIGYIGVCAALSRYRFDCLRARRDPTPDRRPA